MAEERRPANVVSEGDWTVTLGACRITLKASAETTGGAYTLFEVVLAPGEQIPLHFHRHEDEAVFVISGTVAVQADGNLVVLEAGGYRFVPRSTPHRLTTAGPQPARLLLLASPGGLRDLLLSELRESVGAEDGTAEVPVTLGRIAAMAEKYGTEFLRPQDQS